MKLLILADAASAHTLKWVRSLAAQGLDIQLFSLYAQVEPGIQELADSGKIKVHPGAENYAGSLLHRSFFTRVKQLRQLIKTWQPDLVHAYYASSYGLLGALSGFKPYAISVWGSDVYAFPKQGKLYRLLLKYNLRKAKQVFSTSNAMAAETRKYTRTPVEVIPFGVDVEALSTPKRSVHEPFVFGTVKSLAPVYGIDVLLRAFAEVCNETECAVQLNIVGKGPEKASLRALAVELGIEQQVLFSGAIPHAQVPEALRSMDVFCALSREESFGVAIVEAMASGLPVVVSEAPGPAEIVTDGKDGRVVPIEDVQAAARAMLEMLDEARWVNYASEAAQTAFTRYHWPNQVDAQLQAYRLLVEVD